jgi:DNA polymerase delta subunit 1
MKRVLPEFVVEEDEGWQRAPLPRDFSAATHSVTFQQMDIKYVIEKAPVIKMFGCSEEGYSVMLSIHHFMPYIYVELPRVDASVGAADLCDQFRTALNARMKSKEAETHVACVEIQEKMSIMYYREEKSRFFKITFFSPQSVPQARTILESGLLVKALGATSLIYQTYESNVAYILRFMVDMGIGGASWLKMPAGKYRLLPQEERKSTASIEADIDYEDLIVFPVDDEAWSGIAPLRTLSFDIECAGKPWRFPDPLHDPVIQIANYVTVHGAEKPLIVNIFVLNTCVPIPGVDVRCFKTEKELLQAWSEFVVLVDPDILTGYNIVNFDLGYLKDRAEALRLKEFDKFTRIAEKRISVKESKFSSAQTGSRESKEWNIDGRIIFDVYQVVQRDHKLSSYTLNNVASYFLKQQKEDVHHSMITVLHNGTAEDRRRLAIYCCKDALLPQKLIDNLMSLINYIEMARVTGVPFPFLLTRGQGIKVMSQILRRSRQMDLLIPTMKPDGSDEGYKGAKVFDPKIGFYEEPIITLDFASLYPSIMQAHNICYTTLIPKGAKTTLIEGVDYETSPLGDRFVLSTKKKGILPLILDSLLEARGRAKKLMASATDKFKQQVYNGRQLALKVSANSVYGFTGQAVGALPCVEISSTVTAYGRQMILLTSQTVQEIYSIKNGHKIDAEVIYGDTDSVMVRTGVATVADAIKIGKEAAVLVSKKFRHPIKLEFEKVYFPYLLMKKKKYGGLFWTRPDKYDKVDCKGIESVRRDNCGIVRYAVGHVMDKILKERDVRGAVTFSQGIVSDILQNKIDLSLLIITKSYSRDADEYKNPQAHIALAQKMKQRDPATAPNVGDRIPFVIIKGEKNDKMCEKAEDPLFVLANDIPIDSQYYIEQLVSPLVRILEPMIENPEAILKSGDHTQKLVIPRAKSGGGGLSNFVIVRENCLGCKATLQKNEKTLCTHCAINSSVEIYTKYLDEVREHEMQYNRLWTHCQQCQGSFHREVVCAANDCAIFYKRTKALKDCRESQKTLAKFDLSW